MLDQFLTNTAKKWAMELSTERAIGLATRFSMAFSDPGKFGEVLCALISGMHGSGTGGSGFDLSNGEDAAEVKTVCLCQPWKCECDRKSPWTSTRCVHCGSDKLSRVKDSRFGIKPSAHFKYKEKLKAYWLVEINHVSGDDYSVHVWTIDSSNEYFNLYLKTQSEHGSDNCNMLPRSYDFHMCGPRLVYKINFKLGDVPAFEIIQCDKIEDVPYCLLNSDEKKKVEVCQNIPYGVACSVLTIRRKNHGKERGETTRHL